MNKKRFKKLEEETLHNLEVNLKKIYKSQEGNMNSSLYRLDIKKTSWIKRFLAIEIFVFIFLLCIIGFFYVFANGHESARNSMSLKI